MKLRSLLLILLACCISLPGFSKDIPPRSNTLVTDYARVLNASEKQALERKLVAYNDTTSTQIAVVIDNSLEGEEIFDYSYRLASAWGIGQGAKDNGVLIYIAMQDRELFIQTGYGAEGFLTDAMARRIIDQIIVPAFRNGNYYAGLDRATSIVMQLGAGEYVNENFGSQEGGGGISALVIIILLIILVFIIFRNMGNKGGGWYDDGGYGGNGRYDHGRTRRRGRSGGWIIFPGGGSDWGGGGGGFDGGGFGGFGGGGFGGGGAGGSW